MQKINETKSLFFEKISKINLYSQTDLKREKTPINRTRDKWDVVTVTNKIHIFYYVFHKDSIFLL